MCRAESKEYYDYKDMPPLPLTVSRIHIPSLGYTVVDKSCEDKRMASLAIFYDIYKDDQYMWVTLLLGRTGGPCKPAVRTLPSLPHCCLGFAWA